MEKFPLPAQRCHLVLIYRMHYKDHVVQLQYASGVKSGFKVEFKVAINVSKKHTFSKGELKLELKK